MRKFSFYFACFFTLVLLGCGDTSGDPTAQITTLKAEPADVAPGSSTVITATVVKAVGKKADAPAEATVTEPGWGENVTFKLLTANGGQLSSLRQKTDGKGEAMTVYTAGNNYSNDTIQATLDNGMSATIVVKKTGSLVGVIISSFVASPTTVTEGQTSVITAKVTDGNSTNPTIGEAVTFTIATNESGACFVNSANACVSSVTVNSDAGGNAVAIYRAGGNKSTEEVHDTVRGSLANGSSNAVLLTRSVGPAGAVLVLTASPTTVGDGQTSVITATVSGGNSKGANETVTLTIPVNNSGASFINAAGTGVSTITITTGNGGIASAIYRAGAIDSGTTVQDTVEGVLSNGAMSAVSITRSTGPAGAVLTLTASPTTVDEGQASVITATVSGGTNSGVGETVTLTIPLNYSGGSFIKTAGVGVTTITITTGIGGTASAVYRAGAINSGTTVQDTIQGVLSNGAVNAVSITRSAGTSGTVLALSASPTVVNGGQTSVITATVSSGTTAGANEAVTLTIPVNNSGASFINAAGASVSAITITTGSGGTASAIYRAGTSGSGTEVQDTIQGILSSGAMNAVTITVNTGGTRFIVAVSADLPTLASRTSTTRVTATVVDTAGVAQSGSSVTFACAGPGSGDRCNYGTVLVLGPVTTDGAGNAVSSYRGGGKGQTTAGSDDVVATVTIPGVTGTFTGSVTISVP